MRALLISNRVSIALAVLFLSAAVAGGMGWEETGLHYAIGAGMLATGFAAFSFGLIGGGDVKLGAAAAVWLGPSALAGFLLWTALLGGGLALAVLLARKLIRKLPRLPGVMTGLPWLAPGAGIPYGLAIAPAAAGMFLLTPLGRAAAHAVAGIWAGRVF